MVATGSVPKARSRSHPSPAPTAIEAGRTQPKLRTSARRRAYWRSATGGRTSLQETGLREADERLGQDAHGQRPGDADRDRGAHGRLLTPEELPLAVDQVHRTG